MGHFHLAHIDQAVNTGLTAPLAVWAMTQTSALIHVWQLNLTLANLGAAGAAGTRLALGFRREAAGLLTGGSAGVTSPCLAGVTTSTAAVLFGAAALTGTPVATERLYNFSLMGEVAGNQLVYVYDAPTLGHGADRPLFSVRTNQQLALVILANTPAAGTYQITGTVLFEEPI